jgi:hypothetical protein
LPAHAGFFKVSRRRASLDDLYLLAQRLFRDEK